MVTQFQSYKTLLTRTGRQDDTQLISFIKSRSTALTSIWSERDRLIKEWYETIRLDDYLKQRDMESFISNEPKSAYNLALYLLSTASVSHLVDKDNLDEKESATVVSLEKTLRSIWSFIHREAKTTTNKTWQHQFYGLMLATGWYSVFAGINKDEAWATIWNPVQVYPLWNPDLGLIEVARVYSTSIGEAHILMANKGWQDDLTGHESTSIEVIDHWVIENGIPINTVAYGKTIVLNRVAHSDLHRIPIFTGPAGGLPDQGAIISNSQRWPGAWGESIVATNMSVLRNFNRQLTFMQQMLRDTANPRYKEKSMSNQPIANPDDIFKRGAIFRMKPDEDLTPLEVPPIPIEATTSLNTAQEMLSRGFFARQAYGSVLNQTSALVLSQIVASSQHVLHPFVEAAELCLCEIDNWWYKLMQLHSYKPYKLSLPLTNLSPSLYTMVKITPSIPGDVTARATQARMLNQRFQLSKPKVMELLFPEIQDPIREQARVNAETALDNPIAIDMNLLDAYLAKANQAEGIGDTATAARYKKAAQLVEQNIGQRPGGQQPRTRQPGPDIIPPGTEELQAGGA